MIVFSTPIQLPQLWRCIGFDMFKHLGLTIEKLKNPFKKPQNYYFITTYIYYNI